MIGLLEGIAAVLRARFGDEGLELMPEIEQIYDEEQLEKILDASVTAARPAELRKPWRPDGA